MGELGRWGGQKDAPKIQAWYLQLSSLLKADRGGEILTTWTQQRSWQNVGDGVLAKLSLRMVSPAAGVKEG